MIFLTAKPSQSVFGMRYTKQSKSILRKKSFLRKRGGGGPNKKRKESLLTALGGTIKKDPTTSLRKHSNKLEVHKKTVKTAIKQDLCQDLHFTTEDKTNAASHPNIDLLKRNRIKCLKNLFWRHANRFEGELFK